jgi:hypothetical protein
MTITLAMERGLGCSKHLAVKLQYIARWRQGIRRGLERPPGGGPGVDSDDGAGLGGSSSPSSMTPSPPVPLPGKGTELPKSAGAPRSTRPEGPRSGRRETEA